MKLHALQVPVRDLLRSKNQFVYLSLIKLINLNQLSQGWENFSLEGPQLKKIDAKGRIDWKSKKRFTRPQMPCFPLRVTEEQKKKGLDSQ